ncbi:polyphosphate kinase [Mycolicibacterium chitae]|uniref:Polyphosphate:nucleotide phosphotransferase n=1 Tax=Mycolicibacterium chitae TaxID=1792 RepID=A0A3S4T388_MYCCI|nr:polyphosphate kinase 2 family protein [Mycolicibacterium chitae]MCV7109290.1 polyphosphate kinase 2 family protein [Mycolicibacterium chitae]BBZ00927.1 polyphosphate kinase [Mycolicibacterium chitae]VEG49774.1 polyphosphate:nucleotide phosphotransferase [Mycolicibacterium chitae]
MTLPELWTHKPQKILAFKAGDRIEDIDTNSSPGFDGDKDDAPELQRDRNERFAELQEMLYANGRRGDHRSVLLVLQGMDTAGKGGIVEHVVGAGNPMGIQYKSFGVPTPEELQHHYLWRIRKALPTGGQVGVFDRSHYEDVLVVRVHNLVAPDVWGARYDEINAFEKELTEAGTSIVKVAMFVSLEEQKQRLSDRLEDPEKHWKYNPGDLDERALWPQYREAYQAMLDKTSTDHAPWYVVPADKKWYSRLAVTELLIETLKSLQLSWPPADFDVKAEKKRLATA